MPQIPPTFSQKAPAPSAAPKAPQQQNAAGQQRQQHTGKAGNTGEIRRNECGDGTHEKLAFTAQVEHTALVREAGTQGGEHQGRGLG